MRLNTGRYTSQIGSVSTDEPKGEFALTNVTSASERRQSPNGSDSQSERLERFGLYLGSEAPVTLVGENSRSCRGRHPCLPAIPPTMLLRADTGVCPYPNTVTELNRDGV